MTQIAIGVDPEKVALRGSFALAWRRLRTNRWFLMSVTFIVFLIVVALAAPLITVLTGHGPNDQYRQEGLSLAGIPVGPSKEFWLGTDQLGRDVAVRLVYGTRISLLVGVVASVTAVAIGVLIGMCSGYFGGRTDTILTRVIDVVMGLPFLLFAVALVSVAGPSLQISVGVIVLFSWAGIARVIRGQVLSIREKEFIEAARSIGASHAQIMFRDILPNLTVPIIVYGTLMIPQTIVFEATLSFLGLGVVPPTATWGGMIADATNNSLYMVAWWLVLFPSLALLATTLAFNLAGDSLNDALDPRA